MRMCASSVRPLVSNNTLRVRTTIVHKYSVRDVRAREVEMIMSYFLGVICGELR